MKHYLLRLLRLRAGRGVLLPLATWWLAGCAALQIDVDVYKGPLTNTDQIQMRQFAALAIAAKPVLAHVRNDIEVALRVQQVDPSTVTADLRAKLHGKLGHNYYPTSDDRLHSRLAEFINGALLAYEDLGAPALQALLRATEAARTKALMLDYQREDFRLAKMLRGTAQTGPGSHERMAMAEALAKFLCPDTTLEDASKPCQRSDHQLSPTEQAANPLRRFAGELKEPCHALKKNLATSADASGIECPTEARSNDVFAFMANDSHAAALSKLLLGKEDPLLIGRLVQLGRAFLGARADMREAFEASLDLLAEPQQSRSGSRAHLVRLLMQPMITACVLSSKNRRLLAQVPARDHAAAERLRAALSVNSSQDNWGPAQFDAANDAVVDVVTRDPQSAARVLKLAHQAAQTFSAQDLGNCGALKAGSIALGRVESDIARRFGASRGPEIDAAFKADLKDVMDTLGQIQAVSGVAGFDRARLPTGIETLTRNFLQTMHDKATNPRVESTETERRLRETLIAFAERVLFVSNSLTPRVLRQELNVPANACIDVGHPAILCGAGNGTGDDAAGRIMPRLALLQTLGNSLVLHANDLERREAHREAERRGGKIELYAAQGARAPGLARLAADMELQIQSEQRGRAHELEQARAESTRLSAAADVATKAEADLKLKLGAATTRLEGAVQRNQPLADAVRSTVPADQRKDVALPGVAKETASALLADASAGAKDVAAKLGAGSDLLLTAVATEMRAWLTAQADAATPGERAQRLRHAAQALADHMTQFALDTDKRNAAQSIQEFRTRLLTWQRESNQEIDTAAKALAAVAPVHAESQKKLGAGQQAKGRAADIAKTAEAASQQAGDLASAWKAVHEGANAKVKLGDAQAPPSAKKLLLDAVENAFQTVEQQSKQDPARALRLGSLATLKTKIEAVQQDGPAGGELPGLEKDPLQRHVFDAVIADLRQRRVQALASNLTGVADSLLRAINAAYESRSNGIYLRPASDYLKNVYSATALQEPAGRFQRNMLHDYLGSLKPDSIRGDEDANTAEAREYIERQYWQNINQVKLSGGGSTNYVLAKDDVGNWYVKAYEADPKAVIKSAQSLALFGYGKKINVNLLRRLNLQRELDDDKPSDTRRSEIQAELSKKGASENAGLERVREQIVARYQTQLVEEAGALRVSLERLESDAVAAVDAALTEKSIDESTRATEQGFAAGVVKAQGPAFVAASAALGRALATEDSGKQQRALEDAMVEGLRAMQRARIAWVAEMRAKAEIGEARQMPLGAAAAAVARAVIERHGANYKRSLMALEDGIKIVGQARLRE